MKVPVYNLKGVVKKEIGLAKAFSEPVREDLIKRAFLAEQSNKRQPYGSDILAGFRTSAHYHGRRNVRFSMMGREMARMKRIHDQGFLSFRARAVPQAIKGRKAHPPKVTKVWKLKINKKEKLKALRSALAATANKDFLILRGHKVEGIKNLPLIIVDELQSIKKSKEVRQILETLGLKNELERCAQKKQRAGRGKIRGRRYKIRKGPLIVISEDKGIIKAAKNILGIEIVKPNELTVGLLAPGAKSGRLTLWTESAIKNVEKL